MNLLKQEPSYEEAFEQLGNIQHLENLEMFLNIEEFVCKMYKLKSTRVDDARYNIFNRTYNPTDENFLLKIKTYDASKLPPCQRELKPQILRAFLIANMWQNSHIRNHDNLDPTLYGWKLVEGQDGTKTYGLHWFDGPQMPKEIAEIQMDENEQQQILGNKIFEHSY